jgi:hypothetical protein
MKSKLLKAAHIGLILLLLLYSGGQLARLAVKWIEPTHENVRFWTPGIEMVVIGVVFVTLLGILACSIGLVTNPSRRLLTILQVVWLVCFTWFGWAQGGPFRLRELVGIDLSDPAAVRRAEFVHLLESAVVYLVIAVVVGLPVILRWHRNGGNSEKAAVLLQH